MLEKFDIGFSIYFENDGSFDEKLLDRFESAGGKYLFTSVNYRANEFHFDTLLKLVEAAHKRSMNVMVDINGESSKTFDLERIKSVGEVCLRMDDGISYEEIVGFQKDFDIVLNASTTSIAELEKMQNMGLDSSRTLICHNFYPKPNTGLSLERVQKINAAYKERGFKLMTFVPGDLTMRGPIYKGLPTVERHRDQDIIKSIMECLSADSDIVAVGDVDIKDESLQKIKNLQNGFMIAKADVPDDIKNHVFYDRPDGAEELVRDSTMRGKIDLTNDKISDTKNFERGDVVFSTRDFGRYFGEIEIVKKPIMSDGRALVARICEDDLWMLDYVSNKIGIKFE